MAPPADAPCSGERMMRIARGVVSYWLPPHALLLAEASTL
jgi:hypothetical protein